MVPMDDDDESSTPATTCTAADATTTTGSSQDLTATTQANQQQRRQQQQKDHDDNDDANDASATTTSEETNVYNNNNHHDQKTLHIAPMLHVSNYEFRNFFRLMTRKVVLWTEMIVDETIVFNAHDSYRLAPHLHKDSVENPVVCQIGGDDATYMAQVTRLVEDYGYDEINLNMDCPSNLVCGRNFGAILMKQTQQTQQSSQPQPNNQGAVAILKCIKEHVRNIPVSVKCRIGIDELDSMEFLVELITQLSTLGGCKRFVLHARKCILKGLSPRENRLVPPLNYPRVYAICDLFPDCDFWINGGIPGLKVAKQILYGGSNNKNNNHSSSSSNNMEKDQHTTSHVDENKKTTTTISGESTNSIPTTTAQQQQHQLPCPICNIPNGSCTAPPQRVPSNLRGCMLGRAAMDHPAQFWDVDRYIYGCPDNPCQNRRQLLDQYIDFLERAYPRRCCDNDDRVTSRFPSPPNLLHDRPYCPVCREFADPTALEDVRRDNDNNATSCIIETTTTTTTATTSKRSRKCKEKPVIKIYQGVMDRCLKPVYGIFFGLPKSRAFRRACDTNSRDLKMRNCGPAFLLRKALQVMPSELLDQPFIRTEDLKDSDIPVHVSPPPSSSSSSLANNHGGTSCCP